MVNKLSFERKENKPAKVLIFTIHYKGLDETLKFIESAKNLNYDNFEILVISNSRLPEDGKALSKIEGIQFLDNKRNTGCCYPNNQALKVAIKKKCKYIGIFNNDVEFDKGFLIEIIKVMENDEKIAASGGKVYDKEKRNYLQTVARTIVWKMGALKCDVGEAEDNGQFEHMKEVSYIWGGDIIYRVKELNDVNGYDEKFFVYYEPLDVELKLQNKGFKVMYIPKAKVWHKGQTSLPNSKVYYYYNTRNRILFMKNCAKFKDKIFFYPYFYLIAGPVGVLKRLFKKDLLGAIAIIKGGFDALIGRFGEKQF
jgi:GT2 family glycosyltransferase